MIGTAIISAVTFIVLEALHHFSPPFSYGVAAGFAAGMALSCFAGKQDTHSGHQGAPDAKA